MERLSSQTELMRGSLIAAFRYAQWEIEDEAEALEAETEIIRYALNNGVSAQELDTIYEEAVPVRLYDKELIRGK